MRQNVWFISAVQKQQNEADIVDHAVVALGPLVVGHFEQGVAGFLQLPVSVVRSNQLQNLLVTDELPNPIRRHQNELVLLVYFHLYHLRLVSNPHRFRYIVPETPRHRQTLDILNLNIFTLIRQPDSKRSKTLPFFPLKTVNPPSTFQDSLLLGLIARLMVLGKVNKFPVFFVNLR